MEQIQKHCGVHKTEEIFNNLVSNLVFLNSRSVNLNFFSVLLHQVVYCKDY